MKQAAGVTDLGAAEYSIDKNKYISESWGGGGAGVPESPLGHFMQEQFGANPERAPPPRQPNFASATGTTLSNSSLEIWRL